MLDVFFYETFEEEADTLKKALPSTIQAGFTWKTIQECEEKEPPSRLISTRSQCDIPIEWADKLSGILSRSTGYDHLEAYHKQCDVKVPCGYLPLYCNRSVAEQAMLLWMALLRKFPKQIEMFKSFHRDGLTGVENRGKTLLVVGVGNIGYEVVRIGWGLDMTVYGVDIDSKHEDVTYVSIKEGLSKADIIVCAMNLTDENREYFHYDLLREAKTGVIFVNIARGEMSPSSDLFRLLEEGHLYGCALDAYDQERELAVSLRSGKISNDSEVQAALKLAEHPNAILTPHNAFNTSEAVKRKTEHSIEQIVHFMETGQFKWPIP